MIKQALLAVSVILVAGACASTSQMRASPEHPLLTPVPQFLAEQQHLRASFEEGEPRELDDSEWESLDRIQGRFEEILSDVTDIEELSSEEKREVFHLRSRLIALMTASDDDEMICTRQKHAIGTRLSGRSRCTTRSQLERERFSAQELMRYVETQPQNVPSDFDGN